MNRDPRYRQRFRAIAAICLVAALMLILWTRHDNGRQALPRQDRQPEKTQGPGPSADLTAPLDSLPSSQAAKPETPPPGAVESTAIVLPPDYEAEDFTHVPDWIPRPVNARKASAKDASLRSDGLVEGTVRFEFSGETTDALEAISSQLEAAGMLPEPGGGVFSSENPSRRCEVQMAPAAGGGIMVSLSYQGIDHEKGCKCATCSGHHPNPEP
jgi:type IV secretory pathway VirB10-like protein